MKQKTILVVNGPNLNILGTRKPEIYGSTTLAEVIDGLKKRASESGYSIKDVQSNHEGSLIDAIQVSRSDCVGIIINPAAYTHTSVAIRDALEATELPIVEVHISNIHKREEFRHHSYVSGVATAVIAGCGVNGYTLALDHLITLLDA